MTKTEETLWLAFCIFVFCAITFGCPYLVQALWNSVVVNVIQGVQKVEYWQAFGLYILCHILFYQPSVTSAK